MYARRKRADKPRMKISEWLAQRVSSHDICNYKLVCKDFIEHTGEKPTWGSYPVATAKRMIEQRGVGGYVNGREDEEVIGGYEIAVSLARTLVSQFHSTKCGRGSMFWEAQAALKEAGL